MVIPNGVLMPVGDSAPITRTARVVRIEPETDSVYLAFLKSARLPERYSYKTIAEALSKGVLAPCEVQAPAAAFRPAQEGENSASERLCGRAWSLIEQLVSGNKIDQLFDKHVRAILIRNRAKECKINQSTIYRLLARYFEGGMTKLALMPRYRSVTVGSQQPDGQKRRGRPPLRSGAIRSHFVFTADLRKKIKKHLLEKYQGAPEFDDVCARLNNEFFSKPESLTNGQDTWLPETQRPTPAQYRRLLQWVDGRHAFTKRVQRHEWNLSMRPVVGNSRSDTFGPGSEYQVDATGTQVHVVSALDRSINIGTSTLYFSVDLYSSAIVGSHITLQDPSWDAARFALFNSFMPKGEVYRRAGLTDVKDEEVPFAGLPMMVLGDRGELIGNQSYQVVEDRLAVRLCNARSFRGDDKAVVERLFRTIKRSLLKFIKGNTPKHGPRHGTRDPKTLALLNMQELTKLVYMFIHSWNNKPVCEEALLEKEVLNADVPLTPFGVWSWGMQNRTGRLRQVDPKLLYGHLLPTANAVIEDNGIRFRRWTYHAPELLTLGLQTKARRSGHHPVAVHYDESQPERIWLWVEELRRYVECRRHDPLGQYAGWCYADADAGHQKYLERADESSQKARALKDAANQTRLHMEAQAQQQKAEDMRGKAKTVANEKITANRRKERPLDAIRTRALSGVSPTPQRRVVPRLPSPVLDRQAEEFYRALKS